jgi:hypothetical protein
VAGEIVENPGRACRFPNRPFDKLRMMSPPPVYPEPVMKFVCLGYADLKKFEETDPQEMAPLMEECFAYDDVLRRGGHFLGGEALQAHDKAVTLRMQGGKVVATDGPYAETKEQLGGILLLEARDLKHAVELMSKHPGVKFGPFEIRPADETINELITARNKKAGS